MFRYIQAATSPKDVIIVMDVSGSMKGLRLTIAKHTINTILDTLGENDFVNIIAVRIYTISLNIHTQKKTKKQKQFQTCVPIYETEICSFSTVTMFDTWSPVSKAF